MDAIFLSSSAKKSVSPCKQLKNISRRNDTAGANLVSKSRENLAPTNNIHGGGLLFAPPASLSSSYPPPAFLLNPFYQNHQQLLPQQQQQPPLLPLPVPNKPLYSSLPSRTRSLLSSSSNVKNNRTKDQSLTPKRSKSKQPTGKVEDRKKVQLKPTEATKAQAVSKPFVMASPNPLGPDPNNIPKVLTSSYLATGNLQKIWISFRVLSLDSLHHLAACHCPAFRLGQSLVATLKLVESILGPLTISGDSYVSVE